MVVQCVSHHSGMCDVSHRTVQCATRHSINVPHSFPACRVTPDCAEYCLAHFLSDVSHVIVACVTRHSGNVFAHFSNDVSHRKHVCAFLEWRITLRKLLRAFLEWRVTLDCAVNKTTLRKLHHFQSDVSHRIVQCMTRHSVNMFRPFS